MRATGVYQAQLKRNNAVTAARLATAALLIVAGVAGTIILARKNEAGCRLVHAGNPVSGMARGDYVRLYSDSFVYTGIYYYEQGKKGKPTSFVYFVPLYDGEGSLTEVVAAETAKDYRKDEELERRPVRAFKGLLKLDSVYDREDNIEALAELGNGFTREEAEAYLPELSIGKNTPAVTPVWIAAVLGALFLWFNIGYAVETGKLQKRMAGYGVTGEALEGFDREYRQARESFGKAELTENWVFSRAVGKTCVLPLREVVWLYEKIVRHYTNGIPSGTTYTIELCFSDKGRLSLTSKRKQAVGALEAIAARCPRALLGHSPEREQAWKKDYTQFVRWSQERAAQDAARTGQEMKEGA